jgi:hypothetical protein
MVAAEPRQEGAFDADEAELQSIRGGVGSLAASALDELMSGEADDLGAETVGNAPRWQQTEAAVEAIVGNALEVANLRSKTLGSLYPFQLNRAALTHVPSDDGFYEYCLATSIAASRHELKYQRLVRHFERVVRDLLVAFLGGDAIGIRIGWPSEKDWDRMPTSMVRKVALMKRQCRFDDDEWTLDPSSRLDAVRENAKDARIDVVVRRSHGDGRIGGLTILGQCGCGRNDVDSSSRKHEELTAQWIKHFFGRASIPSAIKAFATSQHIVRSDDLYQKQSAGDVMIFDRIRLCLLAQQHPEVIETHKTVIKSLTVVVL